MYTALALALLLHTRAVALDIPEYDSPVTDLAGILDRSEQQRLVSKILTYRSESSIEIGVLLVRTLDGMAIEDVAHDVFQKWGIGKADRDNGVLFLLAWDDHLARLEVGYGLESALTDLESGRIVSRRSQMAAHFREGDVAGGLEVVVDGIIAAVAGDYEPPEVEPQGDSSAIPFTVFFIFFLLVMIMRAARQRRRRKMSVWGRGTFARDIFGGFGGFGGSSGRSSGGGFTFGGGSSGGGGASGGW